VNDLRFEPPKPREKLPDNQRVTKAQLAGHLAYYIGLDASAAGEVPHVSFPFGNGAGDQLGIKALIRKPSRKPHDMFCRPANV
jgi:hypothetical protein